MIKHNASRHIDPRHRRTHGEGCLSVPNIYSEITRFSHIRFSALDTQGKAYTQDAQGLGKSARLKANAMNLCAN